MHATNTIYYTITSHDLAAHLFHVKLTVASPDPRGQKMSLPVWIPGSYMVREFAKNIISIRAHCNDEKIDLKKIDKCSWQATPCQDALIIEYEVYAWDLSVRAAHLDQSHGFFNGCSVFLQVAGQENVAHIVDIQRPDNIVCKAWRVGTALPELTAKRMGFGTYIASSYDELIDHPVEMGGFSFINFTAHGVPHDFVLTGRVPHVDLHRIANDLQKICEAQIAFFEPQSKRAPMSRYVFMTMAVGDGYGGLEHRASTALLCNRNDLPTKNKSDTSDGYRSFLGLCSHEYFHTWNVKRIKPEVFANYNLYQENYTSLLWLFEGFTSYYDDLFLVRTGLIDEKTYFSLLAKTINSVLRGSGRKKQSVAESSFDAWTKYYRQDENSPNAIVSYYAKGSLIGLALDLTIRIETAGQKSLDDVMRYLWKNFGINFYSAASDDAQRGLGETEIASIVEEITGVKIQRFMDKYVRGTEDLPLVELFAQSGIKLEQQSTQDRKTSRASSASFGVKLAKSGADCKLAHVFEGRAAHRAGLSAGDILIAINDIRITAADAGDNLATALAAYSIHETVDVHAFRRDELLHVKLKLQEDDIPRWLLAYENKIAL